MDDRTSFLALCFGRRILLPALLLLFSALVTPLTHAMGGDKLESLEWKQHWPFWRNPTHSGPAIGANIGWQTDRYGSDLTGQLDVQWWRRRLRFMRQSGLRVARVWLFENGEGIRLRHPHSGVLGMKPDFVRNLKRLIQIGEEEKILFYWTLLNGNTDKEREFFAAQYNIQNGKYGDGDFFQKRVVQPISKIFAASPSTFAIDIINEVEGILYKGSAGKSAIRTFIRETAQTIHATAPGIPVTASAGWHIGIWNIMNGLYDDLGLDFFDIHIYGIRGKILGCRLMRMMLGDFPVLLGEYGPFAKGPGIRNWYKVTTDLTISANNCRIAGVFPWKLEDPNNPHHSMTEFGKRRWSPYMLGFFKLLRPYLAQRALHERQTFDSRSTRVQQRRRPKGRLTIR